MKKFIIGFLAVIFVAGVNAQDRKIIKANKSYEAYSYGNAINDFESITDKSIDVKRKLADCYFKTGDFISAELVYSDIVVASDKISDDVYNYVSVLAINKKYEESEHWMDVFTKENPNDSRGKEFIELDGYHTLLEKSDGLFIIRNLSINTENQDFGAAFFGNDMVVFASTRQNMKMTKREWNWNQKPFLDMYQAKRKDNYDLEEPETFTNMNKKFHEGPAAFNKAGDYVIFTRNNYDVNDSEDIVRLQLFYSTLIEGEWTDPEPMRFNDNDYSVGHATLSSDGQTMYFASDMPGGFGGVDIYKSIKDEDGLWGDPINMGDKLNTEGNELFPFIHKDRMLFFASNGHIGIGGLDIFKSTLTTRGEIRDVENLGSSINSNLDDFALILNDDQTNGYFTSNRDGGKGDDDIYSFRMVKPFDVKPMIAGLALDGYGNVLSNTEVVFFNVTTDKEIVTVITNDDGSYEFDAEMDMEYAIKGSKEDYFNGLTSTNTMNDDLDIEADVILDFNPKISLYCLITDQENGVPLDSVNIELKNMKTQEVYSYITDENGDFTKTLLNARIDDEISYEIFLTKEGYLPIHVEYNKKLRFTGIYNIHEEMEINLIAVNIGDDLGELIEIDMIYFDFDQFDIREDAAIELDRIVKVMNENPNMEIELGSHTDCRGEADYNEWLSDERAKSSVEYIKTKIANPERIHGKGYGESAPLNECECTSNVSQICTEEQHQLNRRTEFRIIKM